MIPKKIHYIFLRQEESFPPLFKLCLERAEAMHPDWDVTLYNESMARARLKELLPEYAYTFENFYYNVQKADFLRLALVYLFGGFYMDLDVLCEKPLDGLLDHHLVLGEEKTVNMDVQKKLNLKYRTRVANYMFGGEPGHPFMKRMLEEMDARCTQTLHSQQEILDVTGPGLLTDVYWDHAAEYPDITLLRNRELWCLQPWHHEVACHFGTYAGHLHAGTWRKDI